MSSALPPALFTSGLNYQVINAHLEWIYDHIYEAGDDSVQLYPGDGGKLGKIFASGGRGGAAAGIRPWQPYLAPYIGDGEPPADQGRKIMLRQGFVSDGINSWIPARRNLVFTVPPNCTDGYYIYLVVNLDANGQIIALDYGSGTNLPAPLSYDPDTDDTLPAVAYDLLLVITSTADAVELGSAVSMRRGPLKIEGGNGEFGPRAYFVETSS